MRGATTPAEELAAALSRYLERAPAMDPWAKYPAVLTAEHVAELLGIERDSVGEAVRRGSIPMRKRLGRYVVDQVRFRAWLADDQGER